MCEDNGGYWEDNECAFTKLDNRSDKEACEENGGDWKNKSCDFKDNDDEPAHRAIRVSVTGNMMSKMHSES